MADADLRGILMRRHPAQTRHPGAFSFPELLIVIGIIALLMALLLGTVSRARESAKQVHCASNLRQIGAILQIYANENEGVILRDTTPGIEGHEPWVFTVARYASGFGVSEADLPSIEILHCPSHPRPDIPTSYTINAFRDVPDIGDWTPGGPVPLSAMSRSADLVLLGETPDEIQVGSTYDPGLDHIMALRFHDAWRPEHLPGSTNQRITDIRHANESRSNLLFFDTHVEAREEGKIGIDLFLPQLPFSY